MTFFSADKLKPRRIDIDANAIGSKNPEVQKRLDRIQENYKQLDLILAELEARIACDERLKSTDDARVNFETTLVVKKKRKWRAGKPKSKSKSRSSISTDPRKPR
jgi:hypothetical protein